MARPTTRHTSLSFRFTQVGGERALVSYQVLDTVKGYLSPPLPTLREARALKRRFRTTSPQSRVVQCFDLDWESRSDQYAR